MFSFCSSTQMSRINSTSACTTVCALVWASRISLGAPKIHSMFCLLLAVRLIQGWIACSLHRSSHTGCFAVRKKAALTWKPVFQSTALNSVHVKAPWECPCSVIVWSSGQLMGFWRLQPNTYILTWYIPAKSQYWIVSKFLFFFFWNNGYNF